MESYSKPTEKVSVQEPPSIYVSSISVSSTSESESTGPTCNCNGNCGPTCPNGGPLINPEPAKYQWEIRWWDAFVKKLPLVNLIWGLTRFFYYKFKLEKNTEAWRSIPRPIGSLIELGLMLVMGSKVGAAVASSPLIVVITMATVVMLCGSGVGCVLGGGGELLVIFIWDRDQYRGEGKPFFTETRIYDTIIRDWMVVAPLYSAGRAAVYASKGDKEELRKSCKIFCMGVIATVIGVTLLAAVGFTHFRTI